MDISEIIGLVFHLSCALDRLAVGELASSFTEKAEFIRENRVLYKAVRDETLIIEQEFSVLFPDDEICHLMNLLHQKIIF